MIDKPGIYADIPASEYHDGLTTTPSLSASIANILIGKSPAHARAAHPRLNPDHERLEEAKYELGTAAHAALLQGDTIYRIIPFDEWRTNEAKELVAACREDGAIPLKPKDADRLTTMVTAAREGIASHTAQPPLFTDGKPEQTLVWEDDHGVVCRARLDWLRDDYTAIDDLKTTSASADPRKWDRTLYSIGADLQVAMYRRGVEKLTGIRPAFRYVVTETYPPYAVSVVDLAPSALALAEAKVQAAIDRWAGCIEFNDWPGYDRRVASIEVPTWEEMRWLERQDVAA